MADPNQNMEDAMMDIINAGGQYDDGDNNQQADDGSQYLDLHNEQEIAGEV
jgi:hypothetical protein